MHLGFQKGDVSNISGTDRGIKSKLSGYAEGDVEIITQKRNKKTKIKRHCVYSDGQKGVSTMSQELSRVLRKKLPGHNKQNKNTTFAS